MARRHTPGGDGASRCNGNLLPRTGSQVPSIEATTARLQCPSVSSKQASDTDSHSAQSQAQLAARALQRRRGISTGVASSVSSSRTDAVQKSNTDSHSARNKEQAGQQAMVELSEKAPQRVFQQRATLLPATRLLQQRRCMCVTTETRPLDRCTCVLLCSGSLPPQWPEETARTKV